MNKISRIQINLKRNLRLKKKNKQAKKFMNGLLRTLIKPDWDDNPKRSEILDAANLLQVGEFQLVQLAYKDWYREELSEDKIDKIFAEYMFKRIIPIWATFYARDIKKLDKANALNIYDEKYHILSLIHI